MVLPRIRPTRGPQKAPNAKYMVVVIFRPECCAAGTDIL